jgi:hypothetical protein
MKIKKTLLPVVFLGAACSSTPSEYKYVGPGREPIKNAEGHVVGQKEMLRDAQTGERYEQITYFTPRRDESGNVIGYEEPVSPGIVLRDLQGRRIGVRYSDLRSQGTNPGNDGVTVIIKKPEE